MQSTCISTYVYIGTCTIPSDASFACYCNRFAIRKSECICSAHLTIPIHSHHVNNCQQLQFITNFRGYSCESIVLPVTCNPSEPRTPGRGSHFGKLNTGLLHPLQDCSVQESIDSGHSTVPSLSLLVRQIM